MGAMAPGRWQSWQARWRMGAKSLVNVTSAANVAALRMVGRSVVRNIVTIVTGAAVSRFLFLVSRCWSPTRRENEKNEPNLDRASYCEERVVSRRILLILRMLCFETGIS